MAFDFPNSPSVGQRVTGVGGIVYVWDGVKWASNIGSVTAQSMGDVGRNLLHNPLFNVAQRGAGPFTAGGHTLDRWDIALNTDTYSLSQTAFSDAQRAQIGDEEAVWCFYNAFTGTGGAAAFTVAQHKIERIRRLAGKTVTISFWAFATAGTPKLGISLDQAFGTGGSPSAAVLGNGTAITLSTTLTRYSVTLSLLSAAGKTFGTNNDDYTSLDIWYSSGANQATRAGNIGVQSGTIGLWGVQLEIGSVATPLEKPDPQQDLANCQRFYNVTYYFVATNNNSVGGSYGSAIYFPVTMRNAPTVVFNPTGNNNAGATATSVANAAYVAYYTTATAVGFSQIQGYVTASADL